MSERSPAALATLPDGRRVLIRPVTGSDKELLRRGFERLSDQSRYRRFLAPMVYLSDEIVRYLTEVDHHDHEAMVALDEETREGVGVARYVRAGQSDIAEVAVAVVDHWQGRGVGTLLLEALAARAHEEGISRFSALMLAENEEMMELLQAIGPVRVVDREIGTVEVEAPLPESGPPPEFTELLRLAARARVNTLVPRATPQQTSEASHGA
jgi:GNAT superfamily N-acetyltransferase